MAEKLIFPIGFDLEAAVKEAEGNADKLLRRLETTIKSRPLAVNLKIDEAGAGSINEIRLRMAGLVKSWNELTEAERIANKTSGEYTAEAKKILAEYTRLVGASESYARTLEQIAAAARKAAAEQERMAETTEKRMRRQAEAAAKRARAEAEVAAKVKEAEAATNDVRGGLSERELLTQAYNRQAAALDTVIKKQQQLDRILSSGSSRLTNADGTNSDLKERLLERRLQLTRQIGNETIRLNRLEVQLAQTGYSARMRKARETQRILQAEEKSIAAINAKLQIQQQRLNSTDIGSGKFNKIAAEVKRLIKKLEEAKRKVAEVTGQTLSGATKQAQAVNQVNQELKNQDGYVSRLLKRMAVYAGYSMIGTFLTNVREVTAQFELQRISLGAIIQDQSRANQLFSEIKTFALKSPIKILDLAKYTKQVAAYGVETDKLFDTTKRIMDISVGLGVDASRLVLAYGQVKAASYLRAAEIRQFTEAGIPMLELLAEKFSELNGKAVTTEQVMDMVSKRMVGFNMVEDIFKDMTSAGGMFFDMQEKQGNTLYGMWAKLGDAASVMYDQIGNTSYVNYGMKDLIQLITDLMKNWRLVGREMIVVVGTLALLRANTVLSTKNTQAAEVATNQYAAAQTRLNAAQKAGSKISVSAAKYSARAAVANRAAAMSTNAWTAAQFKLIAATNSLKAAFLGNWITLTIAAFAAIGAAIYSAYEKAHKLQNELKEIQTAGAAESAKSVFNFERLANAALRAANGSKQQNDALDELKRTYKDIIPAEEFTIANLRKMREEGYVPLTAAIKEYIAQRTLQKEIDAITENYTSDTIAKQREVRELLKRGSTYNFFKGVAWSPIEGLDDDQISQVFANVDIIAKDKSKSWQDIWVEAIKGVTNVSEEQEAKMRALFNNSKQSVNQSSYNSKLRDIVDNTRDMATETDAATKKMDEQTGSLGKYGKVLAETNKSLEDLRLTYSNGNVVNPDTFLAKQMNNNAHIKAWKDDIVEVLKDAGIDINNEWFNIIQNLNASNPSQISTITFAPILETIDAAKDKLGDKYIPLKNAITKYQELYNGVVPSDRTISAMRSRLIQIGNNVDKTGNIMNDLQRHLMQSGDSWENYSKSIRDAVKNYEKQIEEMQKINASIAQGEPGSLLMKGYTEDEINKIKILVEALKQLFPFLAPEKSSGNGRKSDPRLQNLKEEISLVQKLYNEYKQLEKQEGVSKAAEDMRKMAGTTIDMFKNKYGFDLPTDAKDLTSALEILYKKMEALPKKIFPALGKELNELRWTIEKVNIDESQKQIEAQLKELADRISRTKTAKEFYDKILSQTGDMELAAQVTLSLYGDTGEGLFDATVKQIQEIFKSNNPDVTIDLSSVIDTTNQRINYGALAKLYEQYQDVISGANHSTAEKIISEGQKVAASNVSTWEKELAKAKDYEQQRTDIINRETQRRADIIKSNLPKEVKQQQIALSYDKQGQDLAKLAVDEFKNSDDFIKVFQDLDRVSTQTLDRMKKRLEEMIATVKDTENVEGLKSLVKQLDKINEERETRNPIEGVISSFKEYAKARKDYRTAEANEASARAAYEKEKVALDQAVTTAKVEQTAAQAKVTELEKQGLLETNEGVAAQLALNDATTKVTQATEKRNKAVKKVDDAEQATTDALDAQKSAIAKLQKNVNAMANAFNSAASSIQTIADMMGIAEDSELGDIVNGLVSGLQSAATIMTTILAIAIAIESACWWLLAIGAAVSVFSALGSWLTGSKVRKANKEIKRQQELLDQLEYAYGRLEKAADKAFGRDYINNFKAQQKNLEAQAAAYQKQADAERSKGKKADKDKIKEYENAYRETMDEIADMQGQVAAQMLGTDLTSAARDFAKAWLEAYKEFGSTADAMSEKFREMVENMVVESLLAKVMERALKPMFDMIDNMDDTDFYSETFWKNVVDTAEQGAKDADAGAQAVMKFLGQAGLSMRDLGGEMTGISREIATASEESVNGLATEMHTFNFYGSHLPTISENVAAMRSLMEVGDFGSRTAGEAGIDRETWQREAFDRFAAMERHMAECVTECRRSAAACEEQVAQLRRVIVPKGTSGAYGVQVYMRN